MIRILIADDHDVVRSGLRQIIEAQLNRQVVAEAGDGKDAVQKALGTNAMSPSSITHCRPSLAWRPSPGTVGRLKASGDRSTRLWPLLAGPTSVHNPGCRGSPKRSKVS